MNHTSVSRPKYHLTRSGSIFRLGKGLQKCSGLPCGVETLSERVIATTCSGPVTKGCPIWHLILNPAARFTVFWVFRVCDTPKPFSDLFLATRFQPSPRCVSM